jgi:hypothetical protein
MAKGSTAAEENSREGLRTAAAGCPKGNRHIAGTKKCLADGCDLRHSGSDVQRPGILGSGSRLMCDVHWSCVSPEHQRTLTLGYKAERGVTGQSKHFHACLAEAKLGIAKAAKHVG